MLLNELGVSSEYQTTLRSEPNAQRATDVRISQKIEIQVSGEQ